MNPSDSEPYAKYHANLQQLFPGAHSRIIFRRETTKGVVWQVEIIESRGADAKKTGWQDTLDLAMQKAESWLAVKPLPTFTGKYDNRIGPAV